VTAAPFFAVKVAEMRPETPLALLLRLEGGPPGLYDEYTLPGATMVLRVPGRADSTGPAWLASPPGRRTFEALVEMATPLGKALAGLARGAELEATPPRGRGVPIFDYRRHDLYLLGHGVGLAPVRAIVLHALTERGAFDHVRVLAEARFLDEIPFRDDFPAWQRVGVRVYQTLARQDVGKWKRTEQAYVHDLLFDLRPDPARSVVFACGPADMVQGVQGVLRRLHFPPQKLWILEHEPLARERAREPERPADLFARIAKEGIWGSGHQKDAPDHSPGHVTPREQPKGEGLAPYQRH
jgi:NAD(P)H-flavin reductase